jgi:putative Mg2+ transporter-C (MgtC) family protein
MGLATTDFGQIVLRLGVALAAGGVIGLNRDLHRKGAGLRTFGLVALATAGVTIGLSSAFPGGTGDVSRVIQGMMAGIGFLGAGVIMRRPDSSRVTGLTTAAAIWFVAGLAVLCGLGELVLVGVMLGFALLLLLGGRALERLMEHIFGAPHEDDEDRRVEPDAP